MKKEKQLFYLHKGDSINSYTYNKKTIKYPLARYFQARDFSNVKYIKKMKVIGVTGSSGKTTIALYIYHYLKSKLDICYIGTHKVIYKDLIIETNNTTLEVSKLIELFDKYNIHCKYIVMEISSHGINQARINLFRYKYLIFTNIGSDHLDYHHTKENYFNVKKSIFISSNALKIINDNEYGRRISIECHKKLSYKAGNIFTNMPIFLNENLMACLTLLCKMKYKKKNIISYLNSFKIDNGRYEIITNTPNKIIVDYAHLPESYEALLNNEECKIIVFGCGGNRDKNKREIIGKIVDKYCKYAIITSDNSRDESFESICKDITKNMTKYEIIKDRKDAIIKGINLLSKNDILYIIGKGDEEYIEESGTKISFSDKKTILQYLKK